MNKVKTEEMKEITSGRLYSDLNGFVFKYDNQTYLYNNHYRSITEINPQKGRKWVERVVEEYKYYYPTEADDVDQLLVYIGYYKTVPSILEAGMD